VSWHQVWDYLYGNRVAIETGTIFLVTAAIKTAPVPGQPVRLYDWFYDCTHQLFNITNTRLTTAPVITPPATEAASLPKP
jgi:hypothetical protein